MFCGSSRAAAEVLRTEPSVARRVDIVSGCSQSRPAHIKVEASTVFEVEAIPHLAGVEAEPRCGRSRPEFDRNPNIPRHGEGPSLRRHPTSAAPFARASLAICPHLARGRAGDRYGAGPGFHTSPARRRRGHCPDGFPAPRPACIRTEGRPMGGPGLPGMQAPARRPPASSLRARCHGPNAAGVPLGWAAGGTCGRRSVRSPRSWHGFHGPAGRPGWVGAPLAPSADCQGLGQGTPAASKPPKRGPDAASLTRRLASPLRPHCIDPQPTEPHFTLGHLMQARMQVTCFSFFTSSHVASCRPTHSSQLTAHTSQLRTQSSEPRAHNSQHAAQSSELISHSSWLRTQSSDLTARSSELEPYSSDLRTQRS